MLATEYLGHVSICWLNKVFEHQALCWQGYRPGSVSRPSTSKGALFQFTLSVESYARSTNGIFGRV